jgi:DnaJ-class molecular chaperone
MYYVTYCVTFRNAYEVLGLKRVATQSEIKEAFYILSKKVKLTLQMVEGDNLNHAYYFKFHPDVGGSDPELAKRFLEIKEAYSELKDDDRRQQLDFSLNRQQVIWHSSLQTESNH